MSKPDFNQLKLLAIFATVVESGSFAGAARKLGSSRSRISEQVSSLEQTLGVRLLQRSTRQLKLTQDGEPVFEQARLLPGVLETLESITTPKEPAGRVAITMNHDIAHKYVLPVLNDFQRRYPKIKLDLIVDDARLDLIDKQIDLAIRIGLPKDESLVARMMHQEHFALFASPEFIAQYGHPKSIKSAEKLPWVLLKQNQQTNTLALLQKGKPVEIKPLDFYGCDSPLAMQQMVVQGLGIGALLPTTVKQELDQGKLIPILPSLISEPLVFSLVYPSRRQVPPRTRLVIDYLLNANIFLEH